MGSTFPASTWTPVPASSTVADKGDLLTRFGAFSPRYQGSHCGYIQWDRNDLHVKGGDMLVEILGLLGAYVASTW